MSNHTSTTIRALSGAHFINHLTNVTPITHLLFAAGATDSSIHRNYFKLLTTLLKNKLSLKDFDRIGLAIKWISMLNTNSSANIKVQRIVEPIKDVTPTGSYPWSSTTN